MGLTRRIGHSRRDGTSLPDHHHQPTNTQSSRKQPPSSNRRPRCLVGTLLFFIYFTWGLSNRLQINLTIVPYKAKLRGGIKQSNATIDEQTPMMCSPLPARLQNVKPIPLETISKEQMEYQIQNYMDENEFGTTGNRILTCRQHNVHFCRGVVKIYRSKAMYHQVKRCLTMLKDANITSRILYADDETGTMVEEDMGEVTLMNSPVPYDYKEQLHRIQCILQQHSIIHRDFNFRNFIANQVTGKINIIDFGDAVVWEGGLWNMQNYNWRNLQNVCVHGCIMMTHFAFLSFQTDSDFSFSKLLISKLFLFGYCNPDQLFSLWWRRHDSEDQFRIMFEVAEPMLKGKRIWRQPVQQSNQKGNDDTQQGKG